MSTPHEHVYEDTPGGGKVCACGDSRRPPSSEEQALRDRVDELHGGLPPTTAGDLLNQLRAALSAELGHPVEVAHVQVVDGPDQLVAALTRESALLDIERLASEFITDEMRVPVTLSVDDWTTLQAAMGSLLTRLPPGVGPTMLATALASVDDQVRARVSDAAALVHFAVRHTNGPGE